jgi:hypothetical protein
VGGRMNDHEFYGRIKYAVDKNIIVYDSETNLNITKKLIYLMYDASFDKMEQLYIPTDVYPDFDFAQPQYGVEIIRDRRLNYDESKKFLEDFDFTLWSPKQQIVLGIWGDEALLGAV